jgi:hypothetical protein
VAFDTQLNTSFPPNVRTPLFSFSFYVFLMVDSKTKPKTEKQLFILRYSFEPAKVKKAMEGEHNKAVRTVVGSSCSLAYHSFVAP